MKSAELMILKNSMLEYLKKYGYSDETITNYDSEICRLISYIHKNQEDFSINESTKQYLERIEEDYNSQKISRGYYLLKKRTCRYFFSFSETGSIQFNSPKDTDLTPYYITIIDMIITNPQWNENRQSSCRNYSRQFFKWLLSCGYANLSGINEQVIREYLLYCSKRMNNKSLSSTRFYLKLLFSFLNEKNIISNSYETLLTFKIPIERKIQKPMPQSEIATVLASIDKSSSIGKRNYAMIMTALKTGLRQCDVINLKLTDIDWKNGIIKLSQSKTGKSLTLPLMFDYGEAICDYLLHGRQKCNSEYVFISEHPPFSKLNRKSIYFHFNQYRKNCGLPPCSFHGIRRMLGSNMAIGGVKIDIIPDVLGHSDLESTRPYIYADIQTMRECALTLEAIPRMTR